jgi:hypothetical protein
VLEGHPDALTDFPYRTGDGEKFSVIDKQECGDEKFVIKGQGLPAGEYALKPKTSTSELESDRKRVDLDGNVTLEGGTVPGVVSYFDVLDSDGQRIATVRAYGLSGECVR